MPKPFIILSPDYPPPLSLNNSQGWRSRHFKTQASKATFASLIEEEKWYHHDRLPIDPCHIYVYYLRPKGRRDLDNMNTAIKGWLDALTDAGVIRDDSIDQVRAFYSEVTLQLPSKAKTMVVVQQVGRSVPNNWERHYA